MQKCISTDPSGFKCTALYWAGSVLPPNFRAIIVSPARPETHKTFAICRTRMPKSKRMGGPICPHFVGSRAKRKEASEPTGSV